MHIIACCTMTYIEITRKPVDNKKAAIWPLFI